VRLDCQKVASDGLNGQDTVQKYMQQVPRSRPPGQSWATFLPNHAHELWACDFLQVTDLLFRPLFACFIVEHGSRRVVHVGVTRLSWLLIHPGLPGATPPVLARPGERRDWAGEMPNVSASAQRCQ
jgi:putative transposase